MVFICFLKGSEYWPGSQHITVLLASNFFYGFWDWRFLTLIWLSIFIDYFVGLLLEKNKRQRARRALLSVSICSNLSILLFFKYFNFFQDSLQNLLARGGMEYDPWVLSVTLPLGISFYTFQTMSYSIDVYRRKVVATSNLLEFAQFVCYFPQLVAGPIERAGKLIPQLQRNRHIEWENVLSGGLLVIWGCFKKAVVADSVGMLIVDIHFDNPASGTHLLLATFGFAIQIYCDFSGYCDIACGLSRCMGIELSKNFNAPYYAATISDFWRRWHISLSHWFRDYLYIGLGGNRCGSLRTLVNLVITMLLCGLWHGANSTYIVWGAYHGGLLLAHRLVAGNTRKQNEANRHFRYISTGITFLLVCYGWMIFRLTDIDLLVPYTMMLTNPFEGFMNPDLRNQCIGLTALLFVMLGITWVAHWIQDQADHNRQELEILGSPTVIGLLLGGGMIVVVLFSSIGKGGLPFIYFQF